MASGCRSATRRAGDWFGALVGCTRLAEPFGESLVYFGLDDGELAYHSLAELQVN